MQGFLNFCYSKRAYVGRRRLPGLARELSSLWPHAWARPDQRDVTTPSLTMQRGITIVA